MSNAAVNPSAGPLLDTPLDVVSKVMDVNVAAALALVQVRPPLTGGAEGGSRVGRRILFVCARWGGLVV